MTISPDSLAWMTAWQTTTREPMCITLKTYLSQKIAGNIKILLSLYTPLNEFKFSLKVGRVNLNIHLNDELWSTYTLYLSVCKYKENTY